MANVGKKRRRRRKRKKDDDDDVEEMSERKVSNARVDVVLASFSLHT
jgi:hypothetical protein